MASVQMNGSADFSLNLTVTEQSVNAAANFSVVAYSLYINPPGNIASWNLTSSNQSYAIKFDGVTIASGGFTYDFRSPNGNVNKVIKSGTYTVYHNADGSKSLTAYANAYTTNSYIGDGVINNFAVPLSDFYFAPTAPSISGERNSDGTEVRANLWGSTFYEAGAGYRTYWRYDGGGWNGTFGNSQWIGGIDRYQKVFVHGHAYDNQGYTAAGEIALWAVPAAPSISATRTDRNVYVVITGGSWNAGAAAVNGYYVQYRLAGGSWSSAVYMSGNAHTFTGLTAGASYEFRAYAQGASYSGDLSSVSTVVIPSGGKRYTSGGFVPTTVSKRYTSGGWVNVTNAKRYTSGGWVPLS